MQLTQTPSYVFQLSVLHLYSYYISMVFLCFCIFFFNDAFRISPLQAAGNNGLQQSLS